jgi:MipA family protein
MTAASATSSEESESAWHFSLGIGAGVRTNPVEYASNIPIIVLPQVEYSGERFFIQNLDMGFIISENKSHQLNVLLTPSYDQMFFDRWNSGNFFVETERNLLGTSDSEPNVLQPGRGKDEVFSDNSDLSLHKRRITALGGLEYNFSAETLDWQLQWVHDLLGVHNGNEARFFVSKNWQLNRSNFKASFGFVWQDEKTLDYYYGLTPEETAIESVYHPDASVSTLMRLDWNYRLTENWDLRLFTSYRQLGDDIKQSPLINDDKIVTLFVGGVYHF